KKKITGLVYQLLDLGLLERSDGEYPVLMLKEASWEVMRGQRPVRLIRIHKEGVRKPRADAESWEGVDKGLFEALRELRRELAHQRGVPPFIIFPDTALRDMARKCPTTPQAMRLVHGVGEKKLADLGDQFIEHIAAYCRQHERPTDVAYDSWTEPAPKRTRR